MEALTFGEKILTLRKKAGLTQKDVASLTGINTRTLTSYENNVRLPKQQITYEKLADLFKVSTSYLKGTDAFVEAAQSEYGYNGKKQAEELISSAGGLFAGGSISEEDKDVLMQTLQNLYWKAKKENREKYTPNIYK